MVWTNLHDPALLTLEGFMYIANCPFNKIKILSEATIGLEKSFGMMYSNIGLNSRETVPLKLISFHKLWNAFHDHEIKCMHT